MNKIPEGATRVSKCNETHFYKTDKGVVYFCMSESKNPSWVKSAFGRDVGSMVDGTDPICISGTSFYDNMTECRRCGGAFDHQMHGECPCLKDIHGVKDTDNVNHPEHYQSDSGIECIDAIRAAVGDDGFVAHCRATAIKYCWRSGKKQAHAEDLRKAAWYLERAASVIEERG